MAGLLNIWGTQYGTTIGGNYQDGPYAISYGALFDSYQVTIPGGGLQTIPVPTTPTPNGVMIVPNAPSGAQIQVGFIAGQLTNVAPSNGPIIWPFNNSNSTLIPTNVYVSINNTPGASVMVRFF